MLARLPASRSCDHCDRHSISSGLARLQLQKVSIAGLYSQRQQLQICAGLSHKAVALELGRAQSVSLAPDQILSFERQGHCKVSKLLQPCRLKDLRTCVQKHVEAHRLESLRHRVRVLCSEKAARLCRTTAQAEAALRKERAEVGFLQFFNLWRTEPAVRALAEDQCLTSAAASLLGTKKLRLYQDCLFLKWPGYSETNWHSDLRMAPFDTNSAITAWIPLRHLQAKGDSGLEFASGSHRDFALGFWRDHNRMDLSTRGYPLQPLGKMELGDVSFHHGWTLHCAPAQPKQTEPRIALSLTYIADGVRLLPRRDSTVHKHLLHSEDQESYQAWLSDLPDGGVARHKLLPIVWDSEQKQRSSA